MSPKAVIRVDDVPITYLIDIAATVSIVDENELRNCHLDEKLKENICKGVSIKGNVFPATFGKASVSIVYKEWCSQEDSFVTPGSCATLLNFAAASNLVLFESHAKSKTPQQ